MIKVLDKTFAMMESLALASPGAVRLSELALRHGINRATCSRIMKELCDLGYARQLSRMDGYTIGPRLHGLAGRAIYRPALVNGARPLIDTTARRMRASILLAERCGSYRYILHHRCCNPALNVVFDELAFNDLAETATGVMMLAHSSKEVLQEVLSHCVVSERLLLRPGEDSANTALLAEISSQGYIVHLFPDQLVMALPLSIGEAGTLALGCSVPSREDSPTRREELLTALQSLTQELVAALRVTSRIG